MDGSKWTHIYSFVDGTFIIKHFNFYTKQVTMLSTNTVSNINAKPYSYNQCLCISIYICNYSGEHITPFKELINFMHVYEQYLSNIHKPHAIIPLQQHNKWLHTRNTRIIANTMFAIILVVFVEVTCYVVARELSGVACVYSIVS